jgi:hypothetical protein
MDRTRLLALSYQASRLGKTPEAFTIEELKEFLTFTDKESYFESVSEWKAEYNEHSQHTRTLRADTKNAQRENNPEASSMQADLDKRSRLARMMLVVRRAGKSHSWALREAAKVAA